MNENMSAYAFTLCSFVYRLMCFLPLLMVLYAEGNGEYPMLDKAREKESPAHSTNIFRLSLRKILQ